MLRKATIGLLALSTALVGWTAADGGDLEVAADEGGVTVLVNEDRTYAEYEYDEPLAGTITRTTRVGRRVDGGCEYSGSGSAKATETRVYEEREVSSDLATCTMVTEGAWVADPLDGEVLFDDPNWDWDGNVKGKTSHLGDVEVWTRSRVRWNTGTNCVTGYLRTSAYHWEDAFSWDRVGYWTSASLVPCGNVWDKVHRGTFADYEADNRCPDMPPLPGPPDVSVTHDVDFTGKKGGASSWSWSLVEGGSDPLCLLLTTHGHTADPN